jgi:GNAT superfamily N-acetyltransferase
MPDASSVVVRRARTEDVEPIVVLWREMLAYHLPLDPRFEVSPAAPVVMGQWIESALENERSAVFVAETAPGALEGYCHATIQEYPAIVPRVLCGYLSELAVRERRRGIGSRLLETAHAWFREKGITYAEVNVSVKNQVARSFWRKHGYTDFIERLRRDL